MKLFFKRIFRRETYMGLIMQIEIQSFFCLSSQIQVQVHGHET